MFFAIGFETTAPSTALTLMRAQGAGHTQLLRVLQSRHDHSRDPRDSRFARYADRRFHRPRARVDGDRLPSLRVGGAAMKKKPIVVSGFEPLDILQSVVMLLRQLKAGEAKVENQYRRVVPWEGNRAALKAMAEVFELRPYFEWRGLGFISQSALRIRDSFAAWDAEKVSQSRAARHRSQGRTVRRSAERRTQARAVQAVRKRMHSRASHRRPDGLVGRIVRGLLSITSTARPPLRRNFSIV